MENKNKFEVVLINDTEEMEIKQAAPCTDNCGVDYCSPDGCGDTCKFVDFSG